MQADAILAMQLQRLTGLEADKLAQEYIGLKADIAGYEAILADEQLILDLIRADLRELKDKYADPRRSVISDEELGDYDKEALIREEYMVVTVTHDGYIKRLPAQHLPRPGPGRPGHHRDQHQGRRLPRAHVRRPDARLHPLLHRPRQGLLAEGLRPAAWRRGPRAAGRSSTCCNSARGRRSPAWSRSASSARTSA